MKLLLSADRIRSVIAGAMTEKDIEKSLRLHKIKYNYTTAPGYLAIRIPCRSGSVLIARTASRSAPYTVRFSAPDGFPCPVPLYSRED